jgi:hypothetical protein
MLRLRDQVSIVDTEYGAVLLDEHKGAYYTLNPSALLVLRAMLDGASEKQTVDALRESYDVEPDTAFADVQAIAANLRSAGLVVS